MNMIIGQLDYLWPACQLSKGKGSEIRRETAREGEGRRGVSPFLLPRAPFVLPTRPYPLSLPFDRLSLKQWGKEWNVFTCNVEILVKPSHYVYSTFVICLSCQCSLLQCVIKAFNKRQCLTVCTNLVHYFFLMNKISEINWTHYVRS